MSLDPADTYYNLLVQGFRAGQLSLKKEVPPGFAQLGASYDSTTKALYRSEWPGMIDLSYYKGRLYIYWGVTPALILFWPFVAVTGHYLFERQAVAVFCALGFLASAALLCALWRRYFTEVSVGVAAACVLALGLATGVPVMLLQCDAYEAATSCGYMLTMLALGAIWCALHNPERRWRWLAVASVTYGLALGARPNLVLGAVILLVPVVHAWRERKPIGGLLMAATVPIILIGLGLMLYNAWRFDSPFEFGVRYQLAANLRDPRQYFSLHFLWLNLRMYFLEPAHWSGRFPFLREIALPPLPPGHQGNIGEKPFGVLTNIPLVWLALTVPLAWRGRPTEARSLLRGFLGTVSLVSGSCVLILAFWQAVALRYEVEFLPAMVLLAAVGILGLERALAPKAFGLGRPVWRRAMRWGWGLLLGFSVTLNLLAGVVNYAKAQFHMGAALYRAGKFQQALGHYELALRVKPDFAEAHNGLGATLLQTGQVQEAIEHYEQALRLNPDFLEAQYSLGSAMVTMGRLEDAAKHYEQAVRIKPDFLDARNNLGVALFRLGRVQEAMGHWEQALRIKPDYAEAHYNLGLGLEQTGKREDAIGHYELVVRIKPDYADAQNRLARLRAVR